MNAFSILWRRNGVEYYDTPTVLTQKPSVSLIESDFISCDCDLLNCDLLNCDLPMNLRLTLCHKTAFFIQSRV